MQKVVLCEGLHHAHHVLQGMVDQGYSRLSLGISFYPSVQAHLHHDSGQIDRHLHTR